MIKLVLADDRALLRDGLRRILSAVGSISVVAETTTGADLLDLPPAIDPAVILIVVQEDWPRIIALTPALCGKHDAVVLLLATTPDPVSVERVMRAGAAGVITTDAGEDEFIESIVRAARGDRVLPSDAPGGAGSLSQTRPLPQLSDREFEVIRMLGSGLTVKQIAETLGLSPKTVSTYRSRIMGKLALDNTAELVRFVLERGLAV